MEQNPVVHSNSTDPKTPYSGIRLEFLVEPLIVWEDLIKNNESLNIYLFIIFLMRV